MKVGKNDDIETITPEHWRKMAEELHVSWPILRERIVEIIEKTLGGLNDPLVRKADSDTEMIDRVAVLIEDRVKAQLSRFKKLS